MTDYFYDLEFLEDGRTIELISIGIVAEDGREYYAVNSEMPTERIEQHTWLMFNVVPSLPITDGSRKSIETRREHGENLFPRPDMHLELARSATCLKPAFVIANEVRDFLLAAGKPVLWADYGAYDHVALCQLWGRMIDLPEGLPMFTCDIQQEALRLGVAWDELPKQESGNHNALADARHKPGEARVPRGPGETRGDQAMTEEHDLTAEDLDLDPVGCDDEDCRCDEEWPS